jgi:hypothetical protein
MFKIKSDTHAQTKMFCTIPDHVLIRSDHCGGTAYDSKDNQMYSLSKELFIILSVIKKPITLSILLKAIEIVFGHTHKKKFENIFESLLESKLIILTNPRDKTGVCQASCRLN